MIFDESTGFYTYAHYIDEANLDLTSKEGEYNIQYTLTFLQDAIGGIVDSELVVIGADSGAGKSTLANEIAFSNTELGKKVYLFSLEGDKYDVINRCRYKHYIEKIQRENYMGLYVTYKEFVINRIPQQGQNYINEIDAEMKKKYGNIKIYNRETDLNIDLFEGHLELIQGDADLIVIDHLHYFEFEKREYEAINEIMKRLKKKQELYRVPIVLVSHLRKKDNDRGFPSKEHLHGSSNIAKQADTVIIIAHTELSDDMENQVNSNVFQTGIRIAKCRAGFSDKIIGIHEYDLNTRKYSKDYVLGIAGNNYMSYMQDNPRWAKHARTGEKERKTSDTSPFT